MKRLFRQPIFQRRKLIEKGPFQRAADFGHGA
jgi:hypothetical protein